MATTVVVTIAGRPYRIACEQGEDRRLQALGKLVDQTLGKLRADFGEIGDTRLIIMTAIKIADDLFEADRRIGDLERRLAAINVDRSATDHALEGVADEIANSLDVASDRVERIVRGLRETGATQRSA